MNPRRRRHQRMRRRFRARIERVCSYEPHIRIGRVKSVDPVTGVAEIEIEVTPAGYPPLVQTRVGFKP